MSGNAAAELEQVLHHDIPLTREMGIRVIDWQNHRLRLHLPLAPNVNHKSTLFGGSLYCGAVLAGWGWLHLRLREAGIDDGHIVIQDGQISYPLPVREDAIAVCDAPDVARGAGSLPPTSGAAAHAWSCRPAFMRRTAMNRQ